MPIEPWWETNPARTPRQELGMVSPELLVSPELPGEPFTRDRHHDYRRRGSITVVRRLVVIKRGFVSLTIAVS